VLENKAAKNILSPLKKKKGGGYAITIRLPALDIAYNAFKLL